ncbi:hypothetical protein NQ314_013985 [Rhamnusium bicolor]|uniref:Uncharacterized protein n=1 Tax=Rhamnusium bicolor TaxID=1586634 RepID=A0AAV8X320_9CUCU|nr:hypothetical protein NQ314_013985 [Rhamnusium bicolor]
MTLSKSEQEKIAARISQEILFDEILNTIRDNISRETLERIHLLTRKDLFNIENTYNLHIDSVRHKVDSVSVESWVTEMKENSNDSVIRIYKKQGECDSNLSDLQKDDFLFAIMNDAQLNILKKYGKDCICIDTESYCNAWCDVMGPVPFRLFDSWYTDRAWRKNVKEKIENPDKQSYAYKVVRTLMEERDNIAFNRMIYQAITYMINDPNLKDFGKISSKLENLRNRHKAESALKGSQIYEEDGY